MKRFKIIYYRHGTKDQIASTIIDAVDEVDAMTQGLETVADLYENEGIESEIYVEEIISIRCVACSRQRSEPNEGRFMDGAWESDKSVPKRFKGKWICCSTCYTEILVIAVEEAPFTRPITGFGVMV